MDSMLLQLIGWLRALVEVAGFALIAQACVGLLAGARREQNPVYQLLAIVTRPPQRWLGACCGHRLAPRALALATFVLLFLLWLGLAWLRLQLYRS